MKLWISNLPPGTSDDDLRAFVRKYTQVDVDSLTHIDGDGSHPGVLIRIDHASETMLIGMQHRLDGMYWNQHRLSVQVMSFSDNG